MKLWLFLQHWPHEGQIRISHNALMQFWHFVCTCSNTLPLFTQMQVLDEGYYNVTFTPCNGRPNSFVIFCFMSSGNTPKEENYSNSVNQCSQLN